ncbi:phage adaptor protein [Pyruvatibacter mobilis]|uniref:phage adaptor protein n=1 Tax=Pyruvatibacter mobilis TaxID=1712261 RepID=UPI003BAB4F23
MRNKGDVKNRVRKTLNRSDVTDEDLDAFIDLGLRRCNRLIRNSGMETVVVKRPASASNFILIPDDFLKVRALRVDGKPLTPCSVDEFYATTSREGDCNHYTREAEKLLISGAAPGGSTILLSYLAAYEALPEDTSSNRLIAVAPDALMYAALVDAGVFFEHEDTDRWEARLMTTIGELQDLEDDLQADMGVQQVLPLSIE